MELQKTYSFIAIEGNIGAGKTSLATRIAGNHGAALVLEQFEDNPFLPKFYKEPGKYAFPLELSFLASRYQQLKDQVTGRDLFQPLTVADYFIIKSLIFARNTLAGDELKLFTRLFDIIISNLPKPDLLVYLYADIERLQSNIRHRGRSYEADIQDSYLEKIQQGYLEYLRQLQNIPVLIIDSNNLDFVNREEDFTKVMDILTQTHHPGVHLFNT
jgi:deoxyadenosine/deoxycytidine kinase